VRSLTWQTLIVVATSPTEDACVQGSQLSTAVRLALVRSYTHDATVAGRIHRQGVAAQQSRGIRTPAEAMSWATGRMAPADLALFALAAQELVEGIVILASRGTQRDCSPPERSE